MEAVEGKHIDEVLLLTPASVLNQAGPAAVEEANHCTCAKLPLEVLRRAINSPVDAVDDDLTDGTTFGGPSLREEC